MRFYYQTKLTTCENNTAITFLSDWPPLVTWCTWEMKRSSRSSLHVRDKWHYVWVMNKWMNGIINGLRAPVNVQNEIVHLLWRDGHHMYCFNLFNTKKTWESISSFFNSSFVLLSQCSRFSFVPKLTICQWGSLSTPLIFLGFGCVWFDCISPK